MALLTNSCRHGETSSDLPDYSAHHEDRVSFRPWLEYMSDLEGIGPEAKDNEGVPLQKSLKEWCSDEDLRYSLALSAHYYHNRNYAKASEILSQLANRKNINPNVRTWLRVSIEQLSDLLALEKDLREEKKQRLELERKLKALSDIEREMGERDSRNGAN